MDLISNHGILSFNSAEPATTSPPEETWHALILARIPPLPRSLRTQEPPPFIDPMAPMGFRWAEEFRVNPMPTDDPWTYKDQMLTALFFPWPELPRSARVPWTPAEERNVMIRLERLIPRFEHWYGFSDAGFAAWVRRHQNAMEKGWARVIDEFVVEKRVSGDDEGAGTTRFVWDEGAWLRRYLRLVHLRDVMVSHRLRVIFGIRDEESLESF
ncbi:hypothetical protein SODALDRAFT_322473 [Sodiomyces alkalinus F11]|uniref:Uncharacterized protein n=1 Tax=Sodiomyces alkalinus (strain CBS 110278 / VKM F-3762 / F11) TaxID=1314773 RepID=A0A3N2Q3G5_SODAK|nr:hypothetical protein SODALDRAFT_322473 [Sodiomyces alkalinus F11]ROT41311.1 hypothetical protein SODALDRAFT_322473 [Sodiomyces alkalinus F11]